MVPGIVAALEPQSFEEDCVRKNQSFVRFERSSGRQKMLLTLPVSESNSTG